MKTKNILFFLMLFIAAPAITFAQTDIKDEVDTTYPDDPGVGTAAYNDKVALINGSNEYSGSVFSDNLFRINFKIQLLSTGIYASSKYDLTISKHPTYTGQAFKIAMVDADISPNSYGVSYTVYYSITKNTGGIYDYENSNETTTYHMATFNVDIPTLTIQKNFY